MDAILWRRQDSHDRDDSGLSHTRPGQTHDQGVKLFSGRDLKLVNRIANKFKRMGEAKAVGIDPRKTSGLMHQEANDKVSNQQTIGFLDDCDWLLAA